MVSVAPEYPTICGPRLARGLPAAAQRPPVTVASPRSVADKEASSGESHVMTESKTTVVE